VVGQAGSGCIRVGPRVPDPENLMLDSQKWKAEGPCTPENFTGTRYTNILRVLGTLKTSHKRPTNLVQLSNLQSGLYRKSESLLRKWYHSFHKPLRFVIFIAITQVVLFVEVVFYYSQGGLLKLICRESGTLCHFCLNSQIWDPEHYKFSAYCNLWVCM